MDEALELRDYWLIVRRRWRQFALPFAGVMVAALGLAFLLPATYRSEVTILVERQTIPADLVATTVTGYVQEQIQKTRQRIVSYENLLSIANEFDLYPGLRDTDAQEVVKRMAESIEIEMIDVEASAPDDLGARVATIAFIVAFTADTPDAAQAVTDELAQRYLDEHRQAREAQAADVEQFLEDEAIKLEGEISSLERTLAAFKQEELRQLPELMDMNLKLYEKTEEDIEATERAIRELGERIDTARAELSLTEPYKEVRSEDGKVMLNADERLDYLTAEYLRATARYSMEHPDVMRLAREIRLLAEQSGDSARADELMGQLTSAQEQLRQARQKYGPEHPEVRRLERSVATLARAFEGALTGGQNAFGRAPALPPDNPRYVALQSEQRAAEGNLRAEREKLASLRTKLAEYDARLFQTPAVDRDYKALSRDYENKQAKYAELKNKQLEARLAQQLESGASAEQFRMLDRAFLPNSPESPNRLGILLLGGLLAFAAGLASVAVAEHMDQTIRGSRMLMDAIGLAPLVVIPRLQPAGAGRLWKP